MNIQVFWDVMPRKLLTVTDISKDHSAFMFRAKQSTSWHGVTSQKAWNFSNADVRTSNITFYNIPWKYQLDAYEILHLAQCTSKIY